MVRTPGAVLAAAAFLVLAPGWIRAQSDDYQKAVLALQPDHYYRLNETDLGPPKLDGQGNPIPVADGGGGILYDDQVADTGVADPLIDGFHEGNFDPAAGPAAVVGGDAPFGLCGLEDTNVGFLAADAGSINLGPGENFADDAMTVALFFRASGSDGGDRIFTNNRPDRSDHFQITLGGSANLVIGIDPTSETIKDALQVPGSAVNAKDNQWHHIVASRNGPTMDNVLVVIDGVDYTKTLTDSTTGWGATGTDAHIASRPGGAGGPNHQTLNGAVDEVSIWLGRQLSVEESQELYWAASTCLVRGKVTRELSATDYGPGDTIDVTLKFEGEISGDLDVIESVPPGIAVGDISTGGNEIDGGIEWTQTGVSEASLTYRITPSACSGDLTFGTSTFTLNGSKGLVKGADSVKRRFDSKDRGPWKSVNVGATGGGEEVLGDHDVLVDSRGSGVKLTMDEFHYLYLSGTGDLEASARVDCMDPLDGGAQGGLMVRGTLDQFSAHAFFYLSPATPTAGGPIATLRGAFRKATKEGTPTSTITISDRNVDSFPIYLRLRRAGGKVVFERSPDGNTFSEVASKDIGTTGIDLPDAALIGLAVSGGTGLNARYLFAAVEGPGFNEVKGPTFRRGDSDGSASLDLTDAVKILSYLFQGGEKPECMDAADADDNDSLDLTDAIYILSFLFQGGKEPAAPGAAACGLDPTPDVLGCEHACP